VLIRHQAEKAEIIPAEPDQGNACAGRLCIFKVGFQCTWNL
jgi:hypothetical protein